MQGVATLLRSRRGHASLPATALCVQQKVVVPCASRQCCRRAATCAAPHPRCLQPTHPAPSSLPVREGGRPPAAPAGPPTPWPPGRGSPGHRPWPYPGHRSMGVPEPPWPAQRVFTIVRHALPGGQPVAAAARPRRPRAPAEGAGTARGGARCASCCRWGLRGKRGRTVMRLAGSYSNIERMRSRPAGSSLGKTYGGG